MRAALALRPHLVVQTMSLSLINLSSSPFHSTAASIELDKRVSPTVQPYCCPSLPTLAVRLAVKKHLPWLVSCPTTISTVASSLVEPRLRPLDQPHHGHFRPPHPDSYHRKTKSTNVAASQTRTRRQRHVRPLHARRRPSRTPRPGHASRRIISHRWRILRRP